MTSRWIDLDGAANVRDLGGLPAGDKTVRRDRLIRSDNLQGLTPDDVRRLVDEHHVRAVADLRTQTEVDLEGPGPLTAEPEVTIEHRSLFTEAGEHTDVEAAEEDGSDDDGPVLMPWQKREAAEQVRPSIVEIYQRYLNERPDSVLAALRMIAYTDGATIVHCAAGKDRTGVVVAMALDEVGVDHTSIVDDYVATGERLHPLLARLKASPTYAQDVRRMPDEQHLPRRESMAGFLSSMEELHGGTANWLRKHGWTDEDAAALRAALLD